MARLYSAVILLIAGGSLAAQAQAGSDADGPQQPAQDQGSQAAQPEVPAAKPAAEAAVPQPAPEAAGPPQSPQQQQPSTGLSRWLDPSTAPFLPVPEIDVDPNSGTTLGIIPTRLSTDDQGTIRQIIAPDIIHNPYFGWGARGRIFSYPSEDTHWSIVGGAKERVESEFDAQFETGRLRNGRWSFLFETVYDRSGTPRFYGFGNNSRIFDQSVYTDQQLYAKMVAGWNITHRWQLSYMFMPRKVTILGANLPNIPSITNRLLLQAYQGLLGLGVTHEVLNRVMLTYDTRDDVTVPTKGAYVVTYGGTAGRNGTSDASLFSEAGIDARKYWSPDPDLTVASQVALRYMPSTRHVPFWALSNLGGDASTLQAQPLRGFGAGRFYDRESFAMNVEMRQTIRSLDFSGTHIDLQLTPFADAGRVFHTPGTFPISHLHPVGGLGIRAIARPSVVGFVDVGMGSEGVAVFTGIDFPF